jgi:hypothetical protein
MSVFLFILLPFRTIKNKLNAICYSNQGQTTLWITKPNISIGKYEAMLGNYLKLEQNLDKYWGNSWDSQ